MQEENKTIYPRVIAELTTNNFSLLSRVLDMGFVNETLKNVFLKVSPEIDSVVCCYINFNKISILLDFKNSKTIDDIDTYTNTASLIASMFSVHINKYLNTRDTNIYFTGDWFIYFSLKDVRDYFIKQQLSGINSNKQAYYEHYLDLEDMNLTEEEKENKLKDKENIIFDNINSQEIYGVFIKSNIVYEKTTIFSKEPFFLVMY